MKRFLLDTSVLIGDSAPSDAECAVSSASLAELHFGVLVTDDPEERASRMSRLGAIEAAFQPLPVDGAVSREWGRLAAAVQRRGGKPRRRSVDLITAATANVAGVPLLTHDVADFAIIEDLVRVEAP